MSDNSRRSAIFPLRSSVTPRSSSANRASVGAIDASILSMHGNQVDREKSIISSTKTRQRQKRRIGDQQHAPFAMTQKNCAGSISQPPQGQTRGSINAIVSPNDQMVDVVGITS